MIHVHPSMEGERTHGVRANVPVCRMMSSDDTGQMILVCLHLRPEKEKENSGPLLALFQQKRKGGFRSSNFFPFWHF
jgi:hypothetical protein